MTQGAEKAARLIITKSCSDCGEPVTRVDILGRCAKCEREAEKLAEEDIPFAP